LFYFIFRGQDDGGGKEQALVTNGTGFTMANFFHDNPYKGEATNSNYFISNTHLTHKTSNIKCYDLSFDKIDDIKLSQNVNYINICTYNLQKYIF
jgi:hypothetical protein